LTFPYLRFPVLAFSAPPLATPVNTQDRPLPLRNNSFNLTPSYRPSIRY